MKLKNFVVTGLLIFLFAVLMVVPAHAIGIIINGVRVKFDTDPVIKNGTVFVPMRGIFEKLGAKVLFEKSTRTVHASRKNKKIKIFHASRFAEVNGSKQIMIRPPFERKGRTYVPLRFISETLGCSVKWHPPTKTVGISSNPKKDPFHGIKLVDKKPEKKKRNLVERIIMGKKKKKKKEKKGFKKIDEIKTDINEIKTIDPSVKKDDEEDDTF